MEYASPISQRIETSISTELNWHAGATMVFLLGGSLQMQVGARIYSLNPNDFLFFKPYELFCALPSSDPYRAYIITVEQSFLDQICPGFDHVDFGLRLLRSNSELPVYHSICTALSQVAYHSFKKTTIAPAKICSSVCDILTILINHFGEECEPETSSPQSVHAQQRAAIILRYINEHYTSQFSLKEISSQVGLHPQYFSVYFKKQFKSNFSDYLNNYRIHKSLPALLSGKDTILDIALANGFNNHKTYGAAFHKLFGCSPREYRSLHQSNLQNASDSAEENDFRFLQRFWNPDSATIDSSPTVRTTLNISLSPTINEQPKNNTKNFITVGRAVSCLRSDTQKYLRQAKEDLSIDYVRIQDIFSDSLFVYYEDEAKNPMFSWNSLDDVFDFLLSIGVKPYPELGYTPSQMASKRQFAGWQYHPNVSFPKSLSLWQLLITRFFEHLISRYGAQEVRSWLFDFWTLPNLLLDESYWYESKEKFFHFYEVSYQAMKKVDPSLQLATPNFSFPSGIEWYRDFLLFAHQRNLQPAFVSARLYSYPDGQQDKKREFVRYNPYAPEPLIPSVLPDRNFIYESIQALRKTIAESCFPHLEIIISEWNVSYFPVEYTRDTSFMGPYIIDTYFRLYPYIAGISYTSLSDLNENFFSSDLLFHGGPGLLDHHGIPKAAYHAIAFAHRFSKDIIQQGANYVVAKVEDGYELLLHNLDFYNQNYHAMDRSSTSYSQRYNVFEGVHTLNCNITIPVHPGRYHITKHRVSRESGSSYDTWIKMGSPTELSRELVRHLQSLCTPGIYCETVTVSDSLRFDEIVPPHGFAYISVQAKGG